MTRRTSSIIPGSFADRRIIDFCVRHDMSKSGYYRLPKKVRAALETVYGPRTIRILPKAEAEFDRRYAKPTTAAARLLQKMERKRVAQAKKAGAAAIRSPRHVTKRAKRQ
jgi:hypothetical protein